MAKHKDNETAFAGAPSSAAADTAAEIAATPTAGEATATKGKPESNPENKTENKTENKPSTLKEVASASDIPLAPGTPAVAKPAKAIASPDAPKDAPATEKKASADTAATVDAPAAEKANIVAIAESSSPRSRRFALMAASLSLAAALGALAGSLVAGGLARQSPAIFQTAAAAPEAATAESQRMLVALASDISALRSSLDTGSQNASAQIAKVAERLDRIEKRVASAAAPETTGAVANARPAAAAEPLSPPRPPAAERPPIDGWVLRDIYDGRALVESRFGGLYEIGPGAMLPGVGRVETIRRQDGRWVVVTSRGIITANR
jgi:hypothetical protein